MKSNTAQDVEGLMMELLLLHIQIRYLMERVRVSSAATIESHIYVPSVIESLIKAKEWTRNINELFGKPLTVTRSDGSLNQGT